MNLHTNRWTRAIMTAAVLTTVGCHGTPGVTETIVDPNSSKCTIPGGAIFNGAPKDGIPALTDPVFVSTSDPGTAYLRPYDRVVGLELGGDYLAVPLNILWWHEVVNLDHGGFQVAITHCPLTGSSMVFDRVPLDGTQFGVSGLLFQSNLIMYDRGGPESLWPQMERGARCGRRSGTPLPMFPALEIRWDRWKALHPETRVLSDSNGYDFEYRTYPYGSYDDPDNSYLLFPVDIDPRRPPKERVLGLVPPPLEGPTGDHGLAFPFGELAEAGTWGVVHEDFMGKGIVIFWDGKGEAAMAHSPVLDGEILRFHATADGIRDEETGSTWSVDGEAVAGPLMSKRLRPIPEAYVAFWFAWAAFQAQTDLWINR